MAISIQYQLSEEYYDDDKIECLKPCPICGKTDKLTITSKSNFQSNYCEYGSATINLGCERCSLDLYEHKYTGSKYEVKARMFIKKWNQRKGEEA